MNDTFLTIDTISEGLYKEKGSKFIALAYPVSTVIEVKEIIGNLRKEYYDARHWCFAYVLGQDQSTYRANDDGEPSGSAGLPILGQIRSKNITNVLVVVIRYFGGTKLGISGLIHAYKTSASEALAQTNIIEKIVKDQLFISFPYIQMNKVMKLIKNYHLEILDQHFENHCQIKLLVRQKLAHAIRNKFQKIPELEVKK